jgi:hypothetical protein
MNRRPVTNVPHIDQDTDLETIRDQAERIAVPNFDWIGEPIAAVVDGLTEHRDSGDPPPAGKRPATDAGRA